jgi:L-threonylcarbamoyladenylate synthase
MCDSFTKGLSTIGFRMPASKIALEVLNKFGPLATTSVNISNQPPINSLDEIIKYFGDKIDYIIEDLEEKSNVSSTIVDVSTNEVKVLRQGDIKL